MKRLLMLTALVFAAGLTLTHSAGAQTYPNRPIRIVVPSGAGGDLDRLARGLGTYMSKELGQPIIVEDHPGGGNMIGLKFFLQQPADGGSVDITSFQVDGMQLAGDLVVPLGIFEKEATEGFRGPTVNEALKSYNVSIPTIKGSIRTFIGHPEFKRKYPERYQIVVNALKRTIERADFQDFIKSQAMQASWRGPEISKSEIYENTAVWEKYLYLLDTKANNTTEKK